MKSNKTAEAGVHVGAELLHCATLNLRTLIAVKEEIYT